MNNIRKYRKEQQIPLEKLAKDVSISAGYLCHLERGTRKNPSIDLIKSISKALNKSVAEVFFSEE